MYELFTGKVMFAGANNNEMIKLILEMKGRVPTKLVKKHIQVYVDLLEKEPFFDQEQRFKCIEYDRVTGQPMIKLKVMSDHAGSKITYAIFLLSFSFSYYYFCYICRADLLDSKGSGDERQKIMKVFFLSSYFLIFSSFFFLFFFSLSLDLIVAW